MKPLGLDHLVLTVNSIEDTIRFYVNVLSFEEVTFAAGRKALKFGNQKFNIHQHGAEFSPYANKPLPGSADICLIFDDPIETIVSELNKHGVEIEEGPVNRTGAVGIIESVYIRDPDMNLLELSNYH